MVARRLSEIRIPTKVVFLTLLTGEEFVDQARHHGHGFVSKLRLHYDLNRAIRVALNGDFLVSEVDCSREFYR